MAISLTAIAAKAGTYPSRVADFGRTLTKFAESVVAHVSSVVDTEIAAEKDVRTSKTTTELDAIDDATVGTVYYDSVLNTLVVFVAADGYETITSA